MPDYDKWSSRPAADDLDGWSRHLADLRITAAPPALVSEAERVVKSLGDRITARMRDLVLRGRFGGQKDAPSGPIWVLRGEPECGDVAGWRRRLADYGGDDASGFRDAMIASAAAHLAAITGGPADSEDNNGIDSARI